MWTQLNDQSKPNSPQWPNDLHVVRTSAGRSFPENSTIPAIGVWKSIYAGSSTNRQGGQLRRSCFARYQCLWVRLVPPASGQSPSSVALVVGNAAYVHASLLTNPKENDVEDIAAILEGLGFAVEKATDLDY